MKEETKTHTDQPVSVKPAKKDNGKMIWMIVAIVAIVALIGTLIYGYVKIKDLNKKISDQQFQITGLQNTKKTLEDAASAAATAATDAAAKAVGNAIASTDDQLIQTAKNRLQAGVGVKQVTVTIKKKDGDFAGLSYQIVGGGEGGMIYKKVNGTWQFIYAGSDAPSSEVIDQFGIPNSIVSDLSGQ
jgi:hypothetical protein